MIWRISQGRNNGYDTYDSAIVVAPDAEAARRIHPDGRTVWSEERSLWVESNLHEVEPYDWVPDPEAVDVELVGVALEPFVGMKVICSSFNAG